MNNIAIKVEGLSKLYRIGQIVGYKTLRESLMWVAATPLRRLRSTRHEPSAMRHQPNTIWALKDISFEVKRGEAVGIIGRNGSGKTTLLKILSRITAPTEGYAEVHGRIGSLLEVGTGFHPELTGRENIYLNGAVIGMKKAEIEHKFDEIVAFAEIEKFLDTPVKRYSSGMYVRLAFSVAAHLEPDILLVDEVLAVGDAQFQKKCLGKMDYATKEGRTVLFVSHNMDAVMRLCQKVILLQNGSVQLTGLADSVINSYLRSDFGTTAKRSWIDISTAPGNDLVRLRNVRVITADGKISENVDISEAVGVSMDYEVIESGHVLTPAFNIFNDRGINIFDSHDTNNEWRRKPKPKGYYSSTVWIPGNFFSEGIIVVGAAVITPDPFSIHFQVLDAVAFNVIDKSSNEAARGDYVGHFPGLIRPLLKWQTIIKSNTSINIE